MKPRSKHLHKKRLIYPPGDYEPNLESFARLRRDKQVAGYNFAESLQKAIADALTASEFHNAAGRSNLAMKYDELSSRLLNVLMDAVNQRSE